MLIPIMSLCTVVAINAAGGLESSDVAIHVAAGVSAAHPLRVYNYTRSRDEVALRCGPGNRTAPGGPIGFVDRTEMS